jgi:uncharacterized protein
MIAPRLRVLLALLLLWAVAAVAADVPHLGGRVNDEAQILKPGTRVEIEQMLAAHERATTNQIAVLTVPSLQGESIEQYAVEVFEAWKLGQKGKDNGILLVIAPQERKLRIEVGYGLEGTMPDITAASIIRNVITPKFKQGDFDAGVRDGVRAILGVLSGQIGMSQEEFDKLQQQAQPSGAIEAADMSWQERILFGAFIFGILGLFTAVGIFVPGTPWFLYFFLIPFWAVFPIVILGGTGTLYVLGTYLIGFPLAKWLVKDSAWYRKAQSDLKKKGVARVGGITFGGSSGGSSWSSGSSGSSSFSGGGGSSGGGGASGSW